MRVEMFVFLVSGAICLAGALGVVLLRNPVHNALSLVATLFGVAVLFVAQEAYFLAAVQVIVYAGAIVVLFLFVIMLLGVDKARRLGLEPLRGQRTGAIVAGVAILGLSLVALLAGASAATGTVSATAPLDPSVPDVNRLGEALFTDYIWALEITAVLLTVAVVGAVVLARRADSAAIDVDEFPEGTTIDLIEAREAEAAERSARLRAEAAAEAGAERDAEGDLVTDAEDSDAVGTGEGSGPDGDSDNEPGAGSDNEEVSG